MLKKKKMLVFMLVTILFIGMIQLPNTTVEAASSKPTFTITPNSEPFTKNIMKFDSYTSKTKHYWLLRSYLEELERTGGGTLVLKKGTYTVTNVLYVPSNVTIKLQNGVTIVKGSETGVSSLNASKSLFQFIAPSKSKKIGVHGEYNGEKNISVLGYGNATIDLNYVRDSSAIIAGHNQNIVIKGIQFKNMYGGHFIEIDATKNATISNNKFIDSKHTSGTKEAINIDTPDRLTNGWNLEWSTFDRTPNANLVIENNYFYNLDRAIGTHKYSEGKYHDRVVLRNNKIEKTYIHPIRIMNWSNAIIENNTFKDVTNDPDMNRSAIHGSGVINPTIQNNTIINISRPMQFNPIKNSGAGSEYDVTYNEFNEKNIEALKTNTIVNGKEDFIRINKEYQKYDKASTDYIYINTSNFTDVPAHNSHYEGITYWSDKGVINGYPMADNTKAFQPDKKLSRSHASVLFTRALNLPEPSNMGSILVDLQDIPLTHDYAKEIAATYHAGIFKGNNGRFMGNNPLTREQMATVLVNAFHLSDNGANRNINLSNVDPSHQANVQIIANLGITNQLDNYNPSDYVTRGQFATFLYRVQEIAGF